MPYDSLALLAGALSKALGETYAGLSRGLERSQELEAGSEQITGQRLRNVAGAYDILGRAAEYDAALAAQARHRAALQELAAGAAPRDVVSKYPDVFPRAFPETLRPVFQPRTLADYAAVLQAQGQPVPEPLAQASELEKAAKLAELAERQGRTGLYGARARYYEQRAAAEPERVKTELAERGARAKYYEQRARTVGQMTPAQIATSFARASALASRRVDSLMRDPGVQVAFLDAPVNEVEEFRRWLTELYTRQEAANMGLADPSEVRRMPPPPPSVQKRLALLPSAPARGWMDYLLDWGKRAVQGLLGGTSQEALPLARPKQDPLGLFGDEGEED